MDVFHATCAGADSASIYRPWVELCRTPRTAGLLEALVLGKVIRKWRWAVDNDEGVDENNQRWTFITLAEWDRDCFLSPSQVYRAMAKLEALGFVAQRQVQRERRGQLTGHPVRHVTVFADTVGSALAAFQRGEWDPEGELTSSRPREQVSSRGREQVDPDARDLASKSVARSRASCAHIRNELPPEKLPPVRTTTSDEFELELADSETPATEQAHPSAAIRADWRPAGADAPVTLDLGDRHDRAAAVFRCWVLVHEKRGNVRLNDKRRKLINRAIKEYGDGNPDEGVATCLDAIRGSLADPYYRETGSAFTDPEHILRIGGKAETRNNVEYFAGLWAEHGAQYLKTGRWPIAAPARAGVGRGPEPLTEQEIADLSDERLVNALRDQTDQRRASTVVLRAVWGEMLARVESGDARTCRMFMKTVGGIKFKPADPAGDAIDDVVARCERRLADLGEPAPSRTVFASRTAASVPTFEEIYNQQVAAGLVQPDGVLRLDLVTLPTQDPKPRELTA